MITSKGPSLGLVEGALMKLLTRGGTVSQTELIADHFRLITVQGPALRGVTWTPGQKVQLSLGSWVQRTYTPLSWDASSGLTQLLAYAHGDGPGRDWARSVSEGDACVIFGPRSSVDLNHLEAPGLLFGDETSFGLAAALRFSRARAQGVRLLFEVDDVERSREVLARIGVHDAELVPRRADDAHHGALEEAAARIVGASHVKSCVLSGKATSIRRLQKHLRTQGLGSRQIQTRAYWSPGKKGLD